MKLTNNVIAHKLRDDQDKARLEQIRESLEREKNMSISLAFGVLILATGLVSTNHEYAKIMLDDLINTLSHVLDSNSPEDKKTRLLELKALCQRIVGDMAADTKETKDNIVAFDSVAIPVLVEVAKEAKNTCELIADEISSGAKHLAKKVWNNLPFFSPNHKADTANDDAVQNIDAAPVAKLN